MHPADVANHGLANRTGTPVRTMMATRPPTRLADNSPAPRRTRSPPSLREITAMIATMIATMNLTSYDYQYIFWR